VKLSLTYDRAGRSEGIAYVTYEFPEDASKAIREFDGANAKGMAISDLARNRLILHRTTNSVDFYPFWSVWWTPKPRSCPGFKRLFV
jgi:RNA recognition motif-containing protein